MTSEQIGQNITGGDFIMRAQSLSFQFSKERKVLDNLSISVPKGSIYGFIGPNGAGKSTTIRLLTGIIPEQGNNIQLFNKPLQEQLPSVFTKIGSLIESPALYLHLSGINNLKYIARLRNIAENKVHEALELVDLTQHGKRKVRQYSYGMKQRLAIAMALLSEPELLLLDEPVNGLDPNGMIEIRKLLMKLNQEKEVTVFISSHLLNEIEKMCTHVAIINHGKIKFEGTIQELSAKAGTVKIQVTVDNAQQCTGKLGNQYKDVTVLNPHQLSLELSNREAIPAFTKELVMNGVSIYEIKVLDGLEEWFMTITNEK